MFQMTGPITVQPFHRKRLRSSRGSRSSNIDRIDRNTLDPRILHSTSDLQGRVVGSQRTHQSRQALLPLRAIDFLRACPVLVPSGALGGSRDFLMMYLGLSAMHANAIQTPLTGCRRGSRPSRSGRC